MDKNKIIIISLIVVILALLAGLFLSMPNFAKKDSKLEIISNDTLDEDGQIEVKLTDLNNTPIVNQTVNITVTDENQTSTYFSAVTNDEGVASLKLDKGGGNYTVNCSYAGNDNYTGSSSSQKLTIEEIKETAVIQESSAQSSSSSNTLNYDSELNLYYDSNGIVVDPDGQHPMGVGQTYEYMVEESKIPRI